MSGKKWTPEEDEVIRQYRHLGYDKVAKMLNRTYKSVHCRMLRMGMNANIHKRRWTEEEVMYLEDHYGSQSNSLIGKRLCRTTTSVRRKAAELNLGAKDAANGLISLSKLFTMLYPRNRTTNEKRLKRFRNSDLKIYRYKLSSIYPNKVTEMVNIDDFWKWAEKHQDKIKFAQLEENSLGIEPKWVKEKRKQEWLENSQKRWAGKGC